MTRTMKRDEVFDILSAEREYQDSRWNPTTTTSHGQHSYEEWLMYMEDYINEAKHLLSRNPRQDTDFKVGCIMRKLGAMAVACMEQNGAPTRLAETEAKRNEAA